MSSLVSKLCFTALQGSHFGAIFKFGVVGVLTAAIYFLVMWLGDSIIGFPYMLSVSAAYFISTIFHYLANRHFTFAAGAGHHASQIIRYLLMWFINYFITIMTVAICVEKFGLSPYIGVCVSVLFTMCVGYSLGRYWVFKIKEGVK